MHSVRRIIAGIGRTFVSTGILVLLFVVYELWGTGIAEARQQKHLKSELKTEISALQSKVTTPTTAYVPLPVPAAGAPLAFIRIDKLGLTKAVVEGVDVNDLKRGPGHYSGTPMPGEAGNVAIAGHRTTYGAPFNRIDELSPGDPIIVTTKQGEFRYEVFDHKIVGPNDNYVLDNSTDNRLTLTTCHPKYSASQRYIVFAHLVGNPIGVNTTLGTGPQSIATGGEGENTGTAKPASGSSSPGVAPSGTTGPGDGGTSGIGGGITAPTQTRPLVTAVSGVSGARVPRGPVFAWGSGAAFCALFFWVLSKRWKKWPAYALGAPIFLLVLFVFFEHFASLLPANV